MKKAAWLKSTTGSYSRSLRQRRRLHAVLQSARHASEPRMWEGLHKLHNRPGARLMAESCTGDVAWVRALSAPWLRLWVYTIKTEKKKDPTYNKALWAATRLWAARRMSTAHWPATRLWAARRMSIFSSGPTRPTSSRCLYLATTTSQLQVQRSPCVDRQVRNAATALLIL